MMIDREGPAAIMGLGSRAKVMLLGTFHFGNPGQDALNHTVDMMMPERQTEIEAVADRLAAFRPTKIAVEAPLKDDEVLKERFRAYGAGAFDLPPSETYQLGFRLAARLGHQQVYPIDAWDRHYGTEEEFMAYASKRGYSEADILHLIYEPHWWERYAKLHEHVGRLIATRPLLETLAYCNSAEYRRVSHGSYLAWPDSDSGDYTLVDFRSGWFNRNLRIFANLKRITESPEDRILVIYGTSHIPLLRHCVEASYLHEVAEVDGLLSS
ncbi:MAG TPA: DUF5694 domain-containing protein [Symbiobacteriaceae bacterium]|jgi:hypothetical protein|nr:DUF5694 domain-containing protein [Symbiobacteriaceae bacterium]